MFEKSYCGDPLERSLIILDHMVLLPEKERDIMGYLAVCRPLGPAPRGLCDFFLSFTRPIRGDFLRCDLALQDVNGHQHLL